MTISRREAKTAKDIAIILRSRGRIIITAPERSGKTTELIKYAEERYPNGRFAVVVARPEDKAKIIQVHWDAHNKITFVDRIAKKLMGEEVEGDDVNEPRVMCPPNIYFPDQFIPVFADDWNLLPLSTRRAIMKRRLFIAAVTSPQGEADAEES